MSNDLVFPVLTDDLAMRQAVAHKPEIRFMDQDNGTVVCSYIVSCDGTFDEMYSREARGIVFKDGKVIARPLHKFSNLNQNQDVLFENIDWSKVVRVMDKRDGSMIHTVAVKNTDKLWPSNLNFDLKSKKSYVSDVAHQAKGFLMLAETATPSPSFLLSSSFAYPRYGDFCNWCVENDLTAIFEWTSPVARIVIGYKHDSLTLLHIRHNVTGEYFKTAELEVTAKSFYIPVVTELDHLKKMFDNPEGVKRYIEETTDVEGVVVQFESGEMLKVKTAWYMERHKAMTFLRERDIAEMVLNETLDDLKSVLVGEGCDITEINAIETRVVAEIDAIIWTVNDIFELVCNKTKKELALLYGSQGYNHPFFKLIMNKKDGKEPDYNGFYERNYLREQFGLRQLNLLQTTAELDE